MTTVAEVRHFAHQLAALTVTAARARSREQLSEVHDALAETFEDGYGAGSVRAGAVGGLFGGAGVSRDVHGEMVAFLLEHGPARVKEIATGVRARRDVVADLLTQEPFSQAERPEGAHPLCVYYTVSRRAPRITEGSRAGLLLAILQDGEWHSRDDIFERAGRSFLTNNAASDLRGAGHVVEYSAGRGYRLVGSTSAVAAPAGASSEASVSLAAPEVSPSLSSASGAASEPLTDRVAA